MLLWLRLKLFFKLRRLQKLVDLAARTDELLIGGKLEPETRQELQHYRDRLEQTIRQLQGA